MKFPDRLRLLFSCFLFLKNIAGMPVASPGGAVACLEPSHIDCTESRFGNFQDKQVYKTLIRL